MQPLAKDEVILFQAIPFKSLLDVVLIIGVITLISLMVSLIALMTKDIRYVILLFLNLIVILAKCFDKIIITNQRITLRTLLINRTVYLLELKEVPYITIDPYTFKKYEWQRKLLRQDFQKFWKNKSLISFSSTHAIEKISFFNKALQQLRLDLFSKSQSDKIIEVLENSWELKQNIQPPIS